MRQATAAWFLRSPVAGLGWAATAGAQAHIEIVEVEVAGSVQSNLVDLSDDTMPTNVRDSATEGGTG